MKRTKTDMNKLWDVFNTKPISDLPEWPSSPLFIDALARSKRRQLTLETEPLRLVIKMDGREVEKAMRSKRHDDWLTREVLLAFETWFAVREIKSTTLKKKQSVTVGYRDHVADRWQALKLLLFPKSLLAKYPVRYNREEIAETQEFELEFDAKAFYADIEIPNHLPPFIEIKEL